MNREDCKRLIEIGRCVTKIKRLTNDDKYESALDYFGLLRDKIIFIETPNERTNRCIRRVERSIKRKREPLEVKSAVDDLVEYLTIQLGDRYD